MAKKKKAYVKVGERSNDDTVYVEIFDKTGRQIGDIAIYSEGLIETSLSNGTDSMVDVNIEQIGRDVQLNVTSNVGETLSVENVGKEHTQTIVIDGLQIKRHI